MTDENYEARAQAHLASIKRDMKASMEDAVVRAMHKVMAEFEAKSDERLMEDWGPGPHEHHSLPARGADQPAQRCPLCNYQHGHAIGCKNNPVDIALNKMAENARKLGLDYEPAPKQRWAVFCRFCNKEWSVSYKHPGKSVCVDCDNALPAQPAPVQDSTCRETLRAQGKAYPRTCRKCGLGPCIGAPKQPPAAQRQWVGLNAEDLSEIPPTAYEGAIWADAKLREKNA